MVARTPPCSIDAEQAVLGAVLIDPGAWPAVSHLAAGDFYRADHRAIYAALATTVEEGQPLDVVLVAEQLERDGQFEAAGGLAYLAELTQNTPSSTNARAYAGIVRDRAERRRLMALAGDLATAAEADRETVRGLVDRFTDELTGIGEHVGGEPARHRPSLTALEDLLDESGDETSFLVDELLPAGGLSLILGKPKAGKSTLARCLCVAVARATGSSASAGATPARRR